MRIASDPETDGAPGATSDLPPSDRDGQDGARGGPGAGGPGALPATEVGRDGPVDLAGTEEDEVAPAAPGAGPEGDDEPSGGSATGEVAAVARKGIKPAIYIVVFALVFDHLVVPQLGGARRAIHLVSQVNPFLLLLAVALELAAFVAYAQLTRVTLPRGTRVSRLTLIRIQLSTKAVTNLVPGGSAAGGTLGYRLLTEAGVDGAHAGFSMATVGLGSAVVLNLLLWLGLLVSIPLDGFDPLYGTAAIVGVVLIGGFFTLVVLLMRGQERAEKVVRAIARRIPKVDEDVACRVVRQIAERMRELLDDPPLLWRSAAWAAANWLLDAASLYVFILAFGGSVSPIELLVAFGLANVLAAIPLTPGGLGVVEAVLTSTLVGFGLDRGTGAIAVVTYRLVAFWLPIPLGALAYTTLKLGPVSLSRMGTRHPIRVLATDAAPLAKVNKWDVDAEGPTGAAAPARVPDDGRA